jgi:putative transposase
VEDIRSLNHTKWECKYHVVWIRSIGRRHCMWNCDLGSTFRDLAIQRECQVIEGHFLPDHIHMLISIPPKYSVSQVIGYLKGKSTIQIARTYMGRKKNFTGQHFWARGYFVTTVGADEKTIRDYIRRQETEDRRLDQLSIFEE